VNDSEQWLLLDLGQSDAAFNMALDEALLEGATETNHPVLRFYGWKQPAASFGYFQKISEIENVTSLRPLVRRPTGGGLVPHDADWTYSVVIPPNHHWYELRAETSYERMHVWIQRTFGLLSISTEVAACCRKEVPGQCFVGHEKSDLLWLGKKIAGAAQRRTKSGLLIQGSVQPQPRSVTRDQWQRSMQETAASAWAASFESWVPNGALTRRAAELQSAKYECDHHNRRR
jgi:lipoate-protein ligase A